MLWEEEPREEKGASLRARACQWQQCVLEEVDSFPNTFLGQPRPLNQQRLSTPAAPVGPVELGQLSKSKGEAFSSLGWRRERHSAPHPICCNFLTKRTLARPWKKGPREQPRALGWCRPQPGDAGGGRAAGMRDRVRELGRPHEGPVTAAPGARGEATRPGRSERS